MENIDLSNDWTNGGPADNPCSGGGITGALACNVTEPIKSLDAELMPFTPSEQAGEPGFQTLEKTIDPNRDTSDNGLVLLGNSTEADKVADPEAESTRSIADAKVTATVPLRRLLRPGNPPEIHTVPVGRPDYQSSKALSAADAKRVEGTMRSNLEALRKSPPFQVTGPALSQLMAGGAGYTIPLNVRGEDDTFIAPPITDGATLPRACIPFVQKADLVARTANALRDKKTECNRVAAKIKTQERINANGGVLDVVAQFFRADEHLNNLKNAKGTCDRELKAISRAHRRAKDDYDAELDKLAGAQHKRHMDAIKSDPKLLAAEEKRRREAAIDTAAAWVKQDEKIQKGMLAYEKNLKRYDDEIAALQAGDDPDKADKIAKLKEDRDRYLYAYDTWLERMVAIKHNRWKDHNRAFEQNRKDGIGPTNEGELDDQIIAAGGDPDEVIRARFPDQQFAREPQEAQNQSQAEKDARTLSGNIAKEPSLGEIAGEAFTDVLTMSDEEQLENIIKYGPSAAKGIGQAVEEGLRGAYDIGKGAIDLNAEFYGFDGFEGDTTEKISRFGDKIEDLGTRGADDRLNERGYFENFNENLEKLSETGSDQLGRKFENLAGQGERGMREATRLGAKGGTMIVGGEAVVIQGLARAGQAARGLGVLDKAGDATRAADTVGDLARQGNTAADAARLSETTGDLGRTASSASDEVGTAGRLLDDGADASGDALKTTTNPDQGIVSVDATQPPPLDPSKTTTHVPPTSGASPLPPGEPPKFRTASPSRQAQDALEAAGVDPHLARVFGSRAAARDKDAAIAAGAFESGVNPAKLYENGAINQEGLRKGLNNYFAEMGVPPENRAAAIDRYMNQPPPSAATASPTPPRAPDAGGAQANALASEAPMNPAELATQPRQRGQAGRYSRAELDKRLAADGAAQADPLAKTQRYTPEDVAAAQSITGKDPAATQKFTPEEMAGAEAPLSPTPNQSLPAKTAPTARMSPDSLPSPEAPTVRMTAAEKAAQQAAETKRAPTQQFTPEELAAAQATPPAASKSAPATQKFTPEEMAGAEAPLIKTLTEVRTAAQPSAVGETPLAPQPARTTLPGAGATEDATARLSPEELARSLQGSPRPAIVPTDPQPVHISRNADGNYLFQHGGRQVEVPSKAQIGQGATSTVFGADQKPNVLKTSQWDPVANHLDDLGRERMSGVVPIPELHKRYSIAPGSQLNGEMPLSGGRLSVLERGPDSFNDTANALEAAGQGIGAERKAALNSFVRPLNAKGIVVSDLKADNFGFRPSTNPNSANALEVVPLDDGMVIVLKPEFAHLAPQMQRHILDPGDMLRGMRSDFALEELRERMADFDKYVDWDAMNGNLPDRPLRTLGYSPEGHGLSYTPNLGLRFSGLAD
ncbi:hypothetical protein [Aliiroseovarius pelagivivens]|nr:hypothetical protein [Aliiroseovarius pelagivivens]